MTQEPATTPTEYQSTQPAEPDQTGQNIEAVIGFYNREEQKLSRLQRLLERISRFAARPVFPSLVLLFVALWIISSLVLNRLGLSEFDPPPYLWLQGIVGLGALLTATVVLSKQDRLTRLEEQRAHLDLKLTLLIEQKTAKLINLVEELRRDLPNVKDRHDPEAAVLQQAMNPDLVIATLDERVAAM